MKKAWGIRSKHRLDCTQHYSLLDYEPLSRFVNNKGQLFFYLNNPENYVIANANRISEIGLTSGSSNLSSIYVPDSDYPEFGYGDFDNFCLLFKLDSELNQIEMYLIQNGKYLKNQYFQRFIDGDFDSEIAPIKQQASAFFEYGLTA